MFFFGADSWVIFKTHFPSKIQLPNFLLLIKLERHPLMKQTCRHVSLRYCCGTGERKAIVRFCAIPAGSTRLLPVDPTLRLGVGAPFSPVNERGVPSGPSWNRVSLMVLEPVFPRPPMNVSIF